MIFYLNLLYHFDHMKPAPTGFHSSSFETTQHKRKPSNLLSSYWDISHFGCNNASSKIWFWLALRVSLKLLRRNPRVWKQQVFRNPCFQQGQNFEVLYPKGTNETQISQGVKQYKLIFSWLISFFAKLLHPMIWSILCVTIARSLVIYHFEKNHCNLSLYTENLYPKLVSVLNNHKIVS